MKNKYVPLEKMSKKKQREYHADKRRTWGGISPVTRCPDNPKAYNRAKMEAKRLRSDDYSSGRSFLIYREK